MRLVFRPMQATDLPRVRQLDRDSFGALFHELTGQPDRLPLREPEYFAHWLATDPKGALVAVADGELVGLNFNHARGVRAWIGPLAMKPGVQLRGGGRRLCELGLAYLESRGCTSIGLDTYANNPVSVSLYLKLGFEIVGGTLVLERDTATAFPEAKTALRAGSATEAELAALVELDESVSGFHRLPDFRFAMSWPAAAIFTLTGPGAQLQGMAVCLRKRGAGMMGSLVVPEDDGVPALTTLLAAAREFYLRDGIERMAVTVAASDLRLAQALFSLGFRTKTAMVRMIREKKERSGSWAGPFSAEKG